MKEREKLYQHRQKKLHEDLERFKEEKTNQGEKIELLNTIVTNLRDDLSYALDVMKSQKIKARVRYFTTINLKNRQSSIISCLPQN